MTRHELETKFSSDQIGSDQHSRFSALISISETLDSLLPLPVRILDRTIKGEEHAIHNIAVSICIWIHGQSVPTFRFSQWIEIQSQIEEEYARTPEILNSPVESWQSINPELCRLLYLQECRAARHKMEDDGYPVRRTDYTDPNSSPAVLLGRKGGQARTLAKTRAARSNGQKGGRPKQARDTSAFD